MKIRVGSALALPFFLLLTALPAATEETESKADEGFETDPRVIEEQVAEIEEEYKAIASTQDLEQNRRRRLLAKRLGRLRHPKAVKLLVTMVQEDRDLRAKIQAMNSLCRIGDLKAIMKMYRYVLKESRTVLPDYLGMALSRSTDPEVGPWVVKKMLKSGNKRIRMAAVEALGPLQEKSALEPLMDLLAKEAKKANREMHVYYELLRSLGQIGGDPVWPILEQSARDSDWRVRLAVAEVLPIHFRTPKAVALMRELLKDEKPIVREIAAISTGEAKMEPLFPQLVLLMREGNLRQKKRSYEAMVAISEQDYGFAPDAWDKWWRDKKAGKLTKEGDIKNRETMSVATYYRFKIWSDRILFVIDVSGSMKDPQFPPHRIEVAHKELKKAIEALSEKTLFNVMTFAGNVFVWNKEGEVPATQANVEKALKWVEMRLMPRGGTNTYDALMKSLELNPLVDTVFFLSDGIPSRGKYELPEEILRELRYANRFRKVIFNTIAITFGKPSIEKAIKYEDPVEMAAFMKDIADLTGGTSDNIDKPFLDR